MAMCLIAWMYQHGDGIVKKPTEAVRFYQSAIELQNSNAMYQLAWMNQQGDGVEKNPA